MTLKVVVEEKGATKAAADLELVGLRAEDVAPTVPALDSIWHADEEARFADDGPGWAKLAEATVQNKARLGQPPEIMRASERLYQSLVHGVDSEGHTTPGRVVFGTDVPYARFHQYGTVNMPKREVVGVSPVARRAMVKVLGGYIAHGAP